MASIQLSGLVSGFDWSTFIDSMMEIQQAPITSLQSEKATNTIKATSLSAIGTRVTDLQTAVNALKADGLFGGRKTTTSNTAWTSTATSATANGAYSFNVTQLATNTSLAGVGDIGTGLSATNNVSGITLGSMATASAVTAGNFTVNGTKVSIALTDSLQDVFDKISTATGGIVTASYNSTTDKISLNSSSEIVLGASNDSSNFLAVARLANNGTGGVSSSSGLGTTRLYQPLASAGLKNAITAVDASGNGSFAINGVNITYNANTDSLSSVLSRINNSSAGVTASYDVTNDRVVLSNKTTGDLGITASEPSGGFLDAIGLGSGASLTRGKNALFSVNGGPALVSTNNTFDAATHGITGLSVTATSESTSTVTVDSDTTAARSAIENFISKFNSLQSYIEEQTKVSSSNGKVSTSTLSGNREVQSWATALRANAFGAVSGLSGAIERLDNLGIDFAAGTGAAQLTIKDSAKLNAALKSKPTEVEAFFKNSGTGFIDKTNTFLNSILGSSGTGNDGTLGTQKNTLTKANTNIDAQIEAIQRRLTQEKDRLTATFTAMEAAQSKMKQMQQQLANAFGTTSSSS